MSRFSKALMVLVLVGSVLQTSPVRADTTSEAGVVLDDATGAGTWGGTFSDVAAASDASLYGQPGACEHLGCRESVVEVALPGDVWAGRPGGVQIAIDWAPYEKHDLDLYVYGPDGALAGRSAGIASTGEAVRVRNAANGRYRVVVVPQLVDGTVAYRGLVEVERDVAAQPTRPLLPNMTTFPVRNPSMRTGAYFADHEEDGTPSCYPEEMAERGARRCLRFDQVIANVGEGPFELRYRMEGWPPSSSCASASTPATAPSTSSPSTPTSSTRPTPTSTTRTSARPSSTGSTTTARWRRSGRARRTASA